MTRELAHFVPDTEARVAAIALGELSSQDAERLSNHVCKAMETHRRIMDDKLKRRREFDEIVAQEGIVPSTN